MTKGELQDELKRRDERIAELRDKIDEDRDLIKRQREHIEDGNNYLEDFIAAFGLTLNAEGSTPTTISSSCTPS